MTLIWCPVLWGASKEITDTIYQISAAVSPQGSRPAIMFLQACIRGSVVLELKHMHCSYHLQGSRELLNCVKFENRASLTGYEHVELNMRSLNCTTGSNY